MGWRNFLKHTFLAMTWNFKDKKHEWLEPGITLKSICGLDSSPMPRGRLSWGTVVPKFGFFISLLTCSCCSHLWLKGASTPPPHFPSFGWWKNASICWGKDKLQRIISKDLWGTFIQSYYAFAITHRESTSWFSFYLSGNSSLYLTSTSSSPLPFWFCCCHKSTFCPLFFLHWIIFWGGSTFTQGFHQY